MACNGIWFLLSFFPEQLCTETTVTCLSEYTVATNSKLNSAWYVINPHNSIHSSQQVQSQGSF